MRRRFPFIEVGVWAIFIATLTYLGWSWWGFGVEGDYALDLTDPLRRFRGEIPYRDFIPTYGALHFHLVAPFFGLGTSTFAAVWISTAILIWLQTFLVARLAVS